MKKIIVAFLLLAFAVCTVVADDSPYDLRYNIEIPEGYSEEGGPVPDDRPSVALVLSGGGAKGIAHIAIIEALESYGIPIDKVFGTSMGALVGGLYAAGLSPKELRAVVTGTDLMSLFTSFVSPGYNEVLNAFDFNSNNVLSISPIIDPTSLNKQGHDEGTRYRTGIYYANDEDLPIIEKIFAEEQKNYQQPLAVEKLPLQNFYSAEDYHQDYLDKNPTGYCHLPESLFEFARKAKEKQ